MIERRRFAINRICCPSLNLENFFRLVADVGLSKVELRTDLPRGRIVDSMSPVHASALASTLGITPITIDALRAFGHLFKEKGILGYVEPLGSPESSLASVIEAAKIIRKVGLDCYKVIYDMFISTRIHSSDDIGSQLPLRRHGAHSRLRRRFRHRQDGIPRRDTAFFLEEGKTHCRDQLEHHLYNSYIVNISIETFAPEVKSLSTRELSRALNASSTTFKARAVETITGFRSGG